jgi:hypothetical protein
MPDGILDFAHSNFSDRVGFDFGSCALVAALNWSVTQIAVKQSNERMAVSPNESDETVIDREMAVKR